MAKITKDYNSMGLPMNINRSNAIPIDNTELWYSLEDAQNYALSGSTSYVGQSIKVIDEATGDVTCYVIGIDGNLICQTIPESLPVNGGDADTVDGKHADDFALASDFSKLSELIGDKTIKDQFDDYIKDVDFSSYATVEQLNNKADADHIHNEYADVDHVHSWESITDKPVIPTIPDSLPANGGNADTLDNMHADDFALSEHDHDGVYVPVDTFNELVGNTKVEDQIKNQLQDIQIEKEIYIQNDEPADAADGTVWIDVDAEPVQTSGVVSIPTVTEKDNGKIMMVVNGRWEAVMVSNGEGVEF